MYITEKYYSKNANGKVIEWSGEVYDNGSLIIYTGQFGNTRKIVNDSIEGKNIGKRNATSKYQQAVKELKAKEKIKIKSGYRTLFNVFGKKDSHLALEMELWADNMVHKILDEKLTINKTDANNVLKPMKAKSYKDVTNFDFPYWLQFKINGFRGVYDLVTTTEGEDMFKKEITRTILLSKEGHEYVLPHVSNSLPAEFFTLNNVRLDGELYVKGEHINTTKRRIPLKLPNRNVSKNSLPSEPVKLYCFDLSIPDHSQVERLKMKDELLRFCDTLSLSEDSLGNPIHHYQSRAINTIVNMKGIMVYNKGQVAKWLRYAVDNNYEGVVLRDLDAEYKFGSRMLNMIKAKLFKSSEFEIIDVILKNEDSTRTYAGMILKNDMSDKTFEVTLHKTEVHRQDMVNNKQNYIGKLVKLDFYERTVYNIPIHIIDYTIREDWDLDINDLNIEI